MVEKEMKVRVKNVIAGEEKYVVARICDRELWYYGRWHFYSDACEVAEEVDGIVVEDGEIGT